MAWSLWFNAAEHHQPRIVPITSAQDLRDCLATLINRGYGSAMLKTNDGEGDRLTVGVEGSCAFVQYTKFNPTTAMVRFASTGQDTGEQTLEFNVGNTPTEMPLRLCISTDLMRRIVEFYFERRQLPGWVRWDDNRWTPAEAADIASGWDPEGGSEEIPF